MTRHILHRGVWTKPDAYEVADLGEWLNRGKQPRDWPRFRIEPPLDWRDLAAKAIIVAGLGAGVAVWWPL